MEKKKYDYAFRPGRKPRGKELLPLIIQAMVEMNTQVGKTHIHQYLKKNFNKDVSYTTIKKYVELLVKTKKIRPILMSESDNGAKYYAYEIVK